MAAGHDADVAYLTGLVRTSDRARYYGSLFAPASIRDDLLALFGFAAEIARIPDLVSDPTLGEIRLQYWRDQLEELGAAHSELPPPLRSLATVVARYALPIEPLVALVEARRADLYADPPATLGDLEGRLGETQSSLFQLAAIIAGATGRDTADLSGHAGVAYGLARRLARLSADRARGRTILPLDRLALESMSGADVFAPEPAGGVHAAVRGLVRVGRQHLNEARRRLPDAPASVRAMFMPLAVVEPLLRRVERLGPGILDRPAALSDLESLVRIGAASLRARRWRPPAE